MSERRPIVGGNWKMNTLRETAGALAAGVAAGCADTSEICDVVVFPPFPYLPEVAERLTGSSVRSGAQDVYFEPEGAFTGEVSCRMLLDLGVGFVLIGHSERRHVIGEADTLVNRKLRAALDAGLEAVLCVGETLAEREAGRAHAVNIEQLHAGLEGVGADQLARLTIAYEPVWAIGTGRTASAEDAADVHRVIRCTLREGYDDAAAGPVRVQYGGSVKASNAADLFNQPEVQGALVGGASLDVEQFVVIVQAAAASHAKP